MTATDCATSRSGTRYLGDDTAGAAARTSTNSDSPPTSSDTPWPENVARTEVPCSSSVMAACGVKMPETPGDSMRPRLVRDRTPAVPSRLNAADDLASGPAGISNRSAVCAVAAVVPVRHPRGTACRPRPSTP